MVQGQKGKVYTYILSTGTLLETTRAMSFFQFDHKKYRIIQHMTVPIFASS